MSQITTAAVPGPVVGEGSPTSPTPVPTTDGHTNSRILYTDPIPTIEGIASVTARDLDRMLLFGTALSPQVQVDVRAAQAILEGIACGCYNRASAADVAEKLCKHLTTGEFFSNVDQAAIIRAVGLLREAATRGGSVTAPGPKNLPPAPADLPTAPTTLQPPSSSTLPSLEKFQRMADTHRELVEGNAKFKEFAKTLPDDSPGSEPETAPGEMPPPPVASPK